MCTMDSKSPSKFLSSMESVTSGLLDIKFVMDVYFFFIVKEKLNIGFLLQMLLHFLYLTIQ